jgi:putative redox protein
VHRAKESVLDMVRVRWTQHRQFVGWDEAGHGVVMDAPADSGGEGTGARPVELLLYALGGCTGMDVVTVLEKKRLDVRGMEVVVTGRQRTDDFPHYYEAVDVRYVVTGVGVPDEAVARAIELSQAKYCSVRGAFGPQVTVTTGFSVVEPSAPGPARGSGE